MFKRIVAATDMITLMDIPVLTALTLAVQNQARLHIIHVLESAYKHDRGRVNHFESNAEIIADQEYINLVAGQMKKTYIPVADRHINIEYDIRIGFPWEEIIRTARNIKSDLIVMGPHASWAVKKGVIRAIGKIGSTVQGVITRENCPVMIVGKQVPEKAFEFRHIVVGVDFSVSSECALCFAAKLARSFGSTIYPFFMLPVPPYPKFTRVEYENNRARFLSRLKKFCDFYLDGTNHEYCIKSGLLVHQELLACAKETDADLILLGSHTKQKQGKWYAGSVVERVSDGSACPVMAINDPEALRPWEDICLDNNALADRERSIHMFDQSSFQRSCVV